MPPKTFIPLTKSEWPTATSLDRMLSFIEPRIDELFLIRFASACCRRRWHAFDEPSRFCIETAEGFANATRTLDHLRAARDRLAEGCPNMFWYQDFNTHAQMAAYFAAFDQSACDEFEKEHPLGSNCFKTMSCAVKAEAAVLVAYIGRMSEEEFEAERRAQCDLLRGLIVV